MSRTKDDLAARKRDEVLGPIIAGVHAGDFEGFGAADVAVQLVTTGRRRAACTLHRRAEDGDLGVVGAVRG